MIGKFVFSNGSGVAAIAVVASWILWCGSVHGADPIVTDVGKQVYQPTRAVETPHVKWANPYVRGPLRVLFIDRTDKMREAIEFAQRLQMNFEFSGTTTYGGSAMLVPTYCRGGFYLGDEPGDRENRLLAQVEKHYDLVVIGNISWPSLPAAARQKIGALVEDGAGLVRMVGGHVGAESDELLEAMQQEQIETPTSLASGVPWQALPIFKHYADSADFLTGTFLVSRYGKGRVVQIRGYTPSEHQILSPGFSAKPLWHKWADLWWFSHKLYQTSHPDLDIPISEIRLLDYDYNLVMLIRVMLYAAAKEPPVVVGDDGRLQAVRRAELSEITFPLHVAPETDLAGLSARFVLRDRDNQIYAKENRAGLSLQHGDNTTTFPVSNVPGNEYFADLWVLRDDVTVGFGSMALKVDSDAVVTEVVLAETAVSVGSTIATTVRIDAGLYQPAALQLRIRQTDNHDRLVRETMFPVVGSTTKVELTPIDRPHSVHQYLNVDLVSGEQVLDHHRVAFTYRDLYLTRTIRLGAWQQPRTSYIQFLHYRQLYNYGFDSTGFFILTSRAYHDFYGVGPHSTFLIGRHEIATRSNLAFMPPIARIADAGRHEVSKRTFLDHQQIQPLDPQPNIRYPCLNDPVYREAMLKRVRDVVQHYSPESVCEYFFDQEPSFSHPWARKGEICFGPNCQQFFRDHLRRSYGNIAAVNQAHGANYHNFEDVPAVTLEQARQNRSLGPAWIDYSVAKADSFNQFYLDLTNEMRSLQPAAKTGDSAPIYGGFRVGEAVDIWQFSRWMKLAAPYPTGTEQVRADFAVPGALINRGVWWGPARTRSKEFAGWHPWNDLFEGSNFWYCYNGDTYSVMAHDLSMFEDFKVRLAQFQEIKNGIGKLLHESNRGASDVAILYSIASVHQWTLTEVWNDVDSTGTRYGQLASEAYGHNVVAWMRLLSDVVGPFRFVSYEQLADDVLIKDQFKTLVLPWAQALSVQEIDAIKRFAHQGGYVLADLRPGTNDAHGKPYDKSPLDELFGVTQKTDAANIRKVRMNAPSGQSTKVPGIIGTLSDLTLRLAGGRAGGYTDTDVPAEIVHKYGRGQAMLLNFAIDQYVDERTMSNSGQTKYSASAPVIKAYFRGLFEQIPHDVMAEFKPRLDGLRNYYFDDGDLRYMGLLRRLPQPWGVYAGRTAEPLRSQPVLVRLPRPAHIYDARAGKYLGRRGSLTARLTPGVAQVFSLLPYKVDALAINVPADTEQGDAMNYQITVQADQRPQRHVLHIAVLNPEGEELRYYTENVNCKDGSYGGSIRLALNETPGQYALSVRDAATGQTGSAPFVVRPRSRESE